MESEEERDGISEYPRRKVRRLNSSRLVEGTKVWLSGLTELLSLVGDECTVIGDELARGIKIRRVCTGETMLVRRENLSMRSSTDAQACSKVLSRVLGDDVSRCVMQFAECQRFWETCTSEGGCRVPHQPKYQTFLGRSVGVWEQWNYSCGACHGMYARDGPGPMARVKSGGENGTVDFGGERYSEFCYEGEHTLRVVQYIDRRRCMSRNVSLYESDKLQDEIDALPNYVTALTVEAQKAGRTGLAGWFPYQQWRLDGFLPSLKILVVQGVNVTGGLTQVTVPSLQEIHLTDCNFSGGVLLPTVRKIFINTCPMGNIWFEQLVEGATEIEEFHVDGCWATSLSFASNNLMKLSMVRMDSLRSIRMWAPCLVDWSLLDYHITGRIYFMASHPLQRLLPTGYTTPGLNVRVGRNVSLRARLALRNHPDAVFEECDA